MLQLVKGRGHCLAAPVHNLNTDRLLGQLLYCFQATQRLAKIEQPLAYSRIAAMVPQKIYGYILYMRQHS